MEFIAQGFIEALRLIIGLDPVVASIAARTLLVSGVATVLAAAIGIPVGTWLAFSRFRGRRVIIAMVNTAMGLPPVVVGLVVVLLLARHGPAGFLGILYTVPGMILAQVLIAGPIVAGLALSALEALDPQLELQIIALGARWTQMARALLWEARLGIFTAVIAGFGRVCAEVGAVMMVGGNLKGETRVLTTSIVLEARQGNYERAIALGCILLLLAFVVNLVLMNLQRRDRGEKR